MQRRIFIGIAGVTLAGAVGATYLLSGLNNHLRNDMSAELSVKSPLQKDEQGILYLASQV